MSDDQLTEGAERKPEGKQASGKYNIHIENANGFAIGDNAQVVYNSQGTAGHEPAHSPQLRRRMIQLRELLNQRLDIEELRTLCSDLDLDYDALRGEGKAAKTRELVSYLERRKSLGPLEEWLRKNRPDIKLPS